MFIVKTFEWVGNKVITRENLFADITKAMQFFNDIQSAKLFTHARFTSHNRTIAEF